jgi:hypothetical protein
MKKVILFETDPEKNSVIRKELSGADSNLLIFDVNSSEQLVSFITSGTFDSAVINFDQLGSLFRLKPYIFKHIGGRMKMVFISIESSPMMELSFSMLGMAIIRRTEELASHFRMNENGVFFQTR